MLNVRRSFRRFYVFVIYVRRGARELNVRVFLRGVEYYLKWIWFGLIQWLGFCLGILSFDPMAMSEQELWHSKEVWSLGHLGKHHQIISFFLSFTQTPLLSFPTFTNFPLFTISLHFKLWSFEEECRESLSKGNPLFSSPRLVDFQSCEVFGFMFLRGFGEKCCSCQFVFHECCS